MTLIHKRRGSGALARYAKLTRKSTQVLYYQAHAVVFGHIWFMGGDSDPLMKLPIQEKVM